MSWPGIPITVLCVLTMDSATDVHYPPPHMVPLCEGDFKEIAGEYAMNYMLKRPTALNNAPRPNNNKANLIPYTPQEDCFVLHQKARQHNDHTDGDQAPSFAELMDEVEWCLQRQAQDIKCSHERHRSWPCGPCDGNMMPIQDYMSEDGAYISRLVKEAKAEELLWLGSRPFLVINCHDMPTMLPL